MFRRISDDLATKCLSLLGKHELHGGGMTYQTLISITTILSDLNTITVAGILYNDATTWEAYRGSCIASFAITSWTPLMHIIFLFWWRRNDVVQVFGGKSISKGVRAIGGLVKWLATSEPGAVEAVGRVRGEREVRKGGKRSCDNEN